MADEIEFITVNNAKIPIDKDKNFLNKAGRNIAKSAEIAGKRESVKNAIHELAQGKTESTVPNLRNDLEQYGGTNDVTFIAGNKDKGIEHFFENGREDYLGDILDTVIEGKILRYTEKNHTIVLENGNFQAVLAMNRDKTTNKKTWLLTGWDTTSDSDEEKKKRLPSDEKGKGYSRHLSTQTKPIGCRQCLGADESFKKIVKEFFKMSRSKKSLIALDSNSKRRKDENGFLHVELTNISKECINPYYGYEIPNFENLGLNRDKIYQVYRKGNELATGAKTFNGLPLLRGHYLESAENPQREHRVGSVGTDCIFKAPYLQASICVTDAEAIRKIESGERVEISCAYMYDAILENGTFAGESYDLIMTNIRGNHVALVEEGRAGSDVLVADSNIKNKKEVQMTKRQRKKLSAFKKAKMAFDSVNLENVNKEDLQELEADLAKARCHTSGYFFKKLGYFRESLISIYAKSLQKRKSLL